MQSSALLRLLQLSSPALPVGAYTYSDGLETLVQQERILTVAQLETWLRQELTYGLVRLDAAMMVRAWQGAIAQDWQTVQRWNHWLSALRETKEMRQQSWQMGRSLVRLVQKLDVSLTEPLMDCGEPCNFAIAFGITAAQWQIDLEASLLGYLQSWLSNLINAGVRLIPLGQTEGQKILQNLYPTLETTIAEIRHLEDTDLYGCGWGVAIASMNHETLYSRLFRS